MMSLSIRMFSSSVGVKKPLCSGMGPEPEGLKALLETAREKLFQERCKRPPPHLDIKMITAWNGEY